MKTTAPKKYCVKPNTGFVGKGQTVNVHVIMQAQREWPQDMMKCKDKFINGNEVLEALLNSEILSNLAEVRDETSSGFVAAQFSDL